MLELRRQHVVGVIAEAGITKGDIRRICERLLSHSAKFFFPEIVDSNVGKAPFQIFAIEVRQAARHGECSDIHQSLDLMRMQRGHKFFDSAGGMADGEECGHDPIRINRAASRLKRGKGC